ncbi:M18 family aminopeptidase [bacterium]|nr:M18 family aminopeptidase [bacterium]
MPIKTTPADGLMHFLKTSPSPFHAVGSLKAILGEAGFTEIKEGDAWKLTAGSKHYVTRGDSSLIAFRLGDSLAEKGFRFVGAHTDSPCLKLKPNAEMEERHSLRLAVEVYGSPLLATWFDRDLSLAGRVFYSDGKATRSTLIDFEKPIAVVPNLAIHLNRSANENRSIQKQTEMVPLIALEAGAEDMQEALLAQVRKHDPRAQSIVSHELVFYDTQAPSLTGLHQEFITSARIDNLLSCYAGAQALAQSQGKATAVLVCSDHEEVGSASAVGAQGTFLKSVVERLAGGNAETLARALDHSVLVSTDNAHGVHPSYPEKHDPQHRPLLNQGPAIKTNWNQRYATSAETAAIVKECFQKAGVPFQEFVSRNDMPCGSTIGPITATVLGVKTVDVGVPTFAMHSLRELAGSQDFHSLEKMLVEFFAHPGWH